MKLSRARFLIFILLISTIVLWVTNQNRLDTTTTPVQSSTSTYNWQTQNTTIWTLSPKEPNNQSVMQASQVTFQEKTNTSEFTNPKLYQIDSTSHTQLNSDKAFGLGDETLEFIDNVIVTQRDTEAQTNTQIKTERLHYHIDQQKIYTKSHVNIETDSGKTEGQGLEIDLQNKTLQLDHKVKSVFTPKISQ